MKKVFILLFTLLMSLNTTATVSQEMQDKVSKVLAKVDCGVIKIDQYFTDVELKYLKNWPTKVLTGLGTALSENEMYSVETDHSQIAFSDPTGEYNLDGYVVRSVAVKLKNETSYIVIYDLRGGEYGREENFQSYYALSSEGTLIKYSYTAPTTIECPIDFNR